MAATVGEPPLPALATFSLEDHAYSGDQVTATQDAHDASGQHAAPAAGTGAGKKRGGPRQPAQVRFAPPQYTAIVRSSPTHLQPAQGGSPH
ncbi:MAG: hypothetical protein EOO65_05810 [Methanosarcinales archaeon]|nr:MAG: hypothetical protein EOO65_05810 [Methanosarcinales archaeon]